MLNDVKAEVSNSSDDNYAHWAEWGIGYWIERQTTGKPGYLTWRPFKLEKKVASAALVRLKKGPLSKGKVSEELKNLISLETLGFYASGKEAAFYRAKSQAFASFLLENNIAVFKGRKATGKSRDGFYYYLREAYGTATGGSTSKFDDGLGGAKMESMADEWREWLRMFD